MDLPRFYSGTNVNRNRQAGSEGSEHLMNNNFVNEILDYLAIPPVTTTRRNNQRISVPTAAPASYNQRHRHHQDRADDYEEEDIYMRLLFDFMGIARGYNENMSDIIHLIRELIAEIRSMRVSRTPTTHSYDNPVYDHVDDMPSPLIPPPPAAAYRAPITTNNTHTTTTTTTSTAPVMMRSTTRPIARRSSQDNPLFNALYTVFTSGRDGTVFEDVVVRPTDEQIDSSTRIVLFSATNGDILHARCPITLEPFEEDQEICEIIHCGHKFSPTAIRSWFQSHVRCPVCRHDIRGNASITPQPVATPLPLHATDVSSLEIPIISAENRHIRSSHILDNFTTEITNIIQNSISRDASFNMTYSFEMYQDDDSDGDEEEDDDGNLDMVD